jgi:hypothetical protein
LQFFRGRHDDWWIGRHGRQHYRRDRGNRRQHEFGNPRNRGNDYHHDCFDRWYADGGIGRHDDR